MAYYCLYDYVIVNDDVEVATQQLQAIILADRCRVSRLGHSYPIFTELDGWVHE
jgi:guanylate kinase